MRMLGVAVLGFILGYWAGWAMTGMHSPSLVGFLAGRSDVELFPDFNDRYVLAASCSQPPPAAGTRSVSLETLQMSWLEDRHRWGCADWPGFPYALAAIPPGMFEDRDFAFVLLSCRSGPPRHDCYAMVPTGLE